MTHITCRLTAKNRDQLRNPTLGNRVWATFLHCLDVLRDLVQEEDMERNGWTMSENIVRDVNLTLVETSRVDEDRRFWRTGGHPYDTWAASAR